MPAPRHWMIATRLLALLLILPLLLLGCPVPGAALTPRAGRTDAQREAFVETRLAAVNTIGGNLLLERADLSIDTLVGTLEVGAVYNSATKRWTWSFGEVYTGTTYTDATGAAHSALAEGEAIPGTEWVQAGPRRIKSKAGLVHHFHGDGRLRWVYWGDAAGTATYPRLQFATEDRRVVAISQCFAAFACDDVLTLTYNAAGQVSAIDDRAGRRAEFDWQGMRLVAARDPLAVEEGQPGFAYEYELAGRLSSVSRGDDRTEFEYLDGRISRVVELGPDNPTHAFAYSEKVDGRYTTTVTDPTGVQHSYRYDARRRLLERRNEVTRGATTWIYPDATAKRPLYISTPDGLLTQQIWQGDDLMVEVQPGGNVVHYTYADQAIDRPLEITRGAQSRPAGPHRPIAEIVDSMGIVEQRAYDPAGRLVAISNGAGDHAEIEWDDTFGQPSRVTSAGSELNLSGYGWVGHAALVFGDSPFTIGNRTFDAVGNRTQGPPLGDPEEGGVVGRGYDANRNIRRIDLGGGQDVEIDVRWDGFPTQIIRPGGADHAMDYDSLGRMVARREMVGGVWHETTFDYDQNGRLASVVRPNGMQRDLTYDTVGHLETISNSRHGSLETFASMLYAGGRLAARHDSERGGYEFYSHDSAGRISSITYQTGRRTLRAYDARGRKTSETYVDAQDQELRALGYVYDLAGRQLQVLDGATPIVVREVVDGRMASETTGNGLTRAFEYEAGVLVGIEMIDAQGASVESTTITRALELVTVASSVTVETTAAGVTTTEAYVLSGQPAGTLGAPDHARVTTTAGQDVSYSPTSNILAEGATPHAYNAEGNRLESVGAYTYSYDPAGFTTQRNGKPLTWTAGGRLASHGADTLAWDAVDELMATTIAGQTTTWLWGGAVLGDAAGQPTRISRASFEIDLADQSRQYRHHDWRGNVKLVSDDAGAVVTHYAYSAYGVESVEGVDSVEGVTFVGRREIGDLMVLGARVYDPTAGRFLSQDPVFQQINGYGYTLGNPIWWQDADGEHPGAVVAGAFVLAVAGVGLGVVAKLTGNTKAGWAASALGGIGIMIAITLNWIW